MGAELYLRAEMTTPGAALVQLESFPVHLAHGHEGDLHAWPHQLQVGHLVTAAQDLKTQLDTLLQQPKI